MPERSAHDLLRKGRQRLLAATPFVIGGMILAWSTVRGLRPGSRAAHLSTHPSASPEELSDQILGRDKKNVVRLLGEPRTFAAPATDVASGESSFMGADVWYYVVHHNAHAAMAVYFQDGIARRVEVFRAAGVKV